MNKVQQPNNWSFVCHLDYGLTGTVAMVSHKDDHTSTHTLETSKESGMDTHYKPVFLGVDQTGKVILLDPESRQIHQQSSFPADSFAAYAYRDSDNGRIWFMNDGDKETGNDSLNCGDKGSSVTVIDTANGNNSPKLLKTICVGRGHHVTTFTAPSDSTPQIHRKAFVSNLMDGTISVVGNDMADTENFLKVIDTINLCEPDREADGKASMPNNAFPHGMMFSRATGKLYNLNNGYHTIAVIDPVTHDIENTIELPASSNLLLSPDGRFLVGKGVDRKSDQDHVIGKISLVEAQSGTIHEVIDLPDIYPSTYRFNADGSKLYVTTAATGKGSQKDNVKTDLLLIFDTAKLPAIKLLKEIQVGVADCGRRPIAFAENNGSNGVVFVPNPTDGTVTIIDGKDEQEIETVKVGKPSVTEFSFSFWDGAITGC